MGGHAEVLHPDHNDAQFGKATPGKIGMWIFLELMECPFQGS